MKSDTVVMLLRQINSALSTDNRMLPERISALSLSQIYLLDELYTMAQKRYKILSLSGLAQESGFSKATICVTLKGLRKLGYVKMQIDNVDSRRKDIILTERAREVEPDIRQYIAEFNHAICKGIPEQGLQSFEKALRTVLQNARNVRARGP